MPRTKRIVCLANSRKLNGRCIAGRELVSGEPGEWIRPVSNREHEEVSEYERQYEDGSDPRVLDVIDVPVLRSAGHTYQRENWLLDPDYYWRKTDEISWAELGPLVSPPGPLWVDGDSTYHGSNDRIAGDHAASLTSSLALIHVDELDLHVFAPSEAFGNPKRRVQASFQHNGVHYALRVTDPSQEGRFLAQPNGAYRMAECYLTISLAEPFMGDTYKLVATIIERSP
jgi:hypothetical protein